MSISIQLTESGISCVEHTFYEDSDEIKLLFLRFYTQHHGYWLCRTEIATLRFENIKFVAPKDHWVFQVRGKHNLIREAVIGPSLKIHLDRWIVTAGLEAGYIFPSMDNNTEELSDEPMHTNTFKRFASCLSR